VLPSPWLDVGANLFSPLGTVGAFGVAMYLLRKVSLPMPIPTGDGHANEAEFIGLVPPGQTVQRPAPREWAVSCFSPEPGIGVCARLKLSC
jgi:hypothetical protein